MSHFQPNDSCSLSSGSLHVWLAAQRQAEKLRSKLCCRRRARIQAANDAVDAYMRKSGTKDCQAAFAHIRHTRPDLFADMQEPSGLVCAANFNPNHDDLGRFTSGDGAEGGADRKMKASGTKPYDHKLSSHPYKQAQATGACSAAILREAIAQISRMTGDEVLLPIDKAKYEINRANGKSFDYSDAGSHDAPAMSDLPAALNNNGVNSEKLSPKSNNDRSNLDQIASHLENGPVMVAADRGGDIYHAELIMGQNSDGSYNAYNPLSGREDILYASQINPKAVYALSPLSSAGKKTGSSSSHGGSSHHR